MKINRFIALAAIALLVVGTMGFLSYQALAQTDSTPAVSDCGPETEEDDAAEAAETGPDADDIQEECGNQVEDETDDADGPEDDDAVPAGKAAITPEEAEAAALAEFPGATVVEVELEDEGGVLAYSVEFDDGTEVVVDANDGSFITTEVDDD